ncbi:GatB/YqeY domain-containing protein [Virgibacillus sp. W0430]|uniref:GatB/YqeY domain-containing protein n=1 Tax=Virgibacillus sp. W0430 TaxID=3391580 RepID=UPI003F481E98
MTISDRLNEDMKQAMRDKNKEKLSVIRMIKASLQNELIRTGEETLSGDSELSILSRELKQRKDSLQEFKSAGRDDLVQKLEVELSIVENYLPTQMTKDELELIVKQTITEVNATSKQDIGKVMSAIMPKVKGKADGSLINKMVINQLTKQ